MMKQLAFYFLVMAFLSGCESQEKRPEVDVSALTGTWRHVAYSSQGENGRFTWRDIDEEDQRSLTFRPDGALVDQNGKSLCCMPAAFYLNGRRFDTVFPEEAEAQPNCAAVLCGTCEAFYLEYEGNELVIAGCSPSGSKNKYVKEDI